jgi:hypothetical protein
LPRVEDYQPEPLADELPDRPPARICGLADVIEISWSMLNSKSLHRIQRGVYVTSFA